MSETPPESTLDSRIQALAAALGQDVGIVQAAIIALAGGPIPVDLQPDTLAALESIQAVISSGIISVDNFPGVYPLPVEQVEALATESLVDEIQTLIARTPVLTEGRVPVTIEGGAISVTSSFTSVISSANSTNIPLGANETFTGEWEDVKDYAAINAAFLTDVDSAPLGASIEFSADGVSRITGEASSVVGGYGGFASIAPQARYVRVTYTNGPVAQSFLRAEVRYAFTAPGATQNPLGGPTTDASIATLTKSALQGKVLDGPYAGLWTAIGTDGQGALKVAGEVTTTAITDDELRAADVNTADSGEREYTHVVATVTDTGVTVVHTPAPGKAIRLRWIYAINNPTASDAPLIQVWLGPEEVYRVYALSKRQRITGPVDGALAIQLSLAANVAVTAVLEEV